MVVHAVDGTYELFRHFYGLRRFNKGRDAPLGAVAGVLQTLLQMIEQDATLCERVVYDVESGQALTATFLDYAMPRASMMRHFEMTMDEATPCLTNPMGVKGVGELGTIGATPAVVNAVVDALARNGFERGALALQMPLTPERVWRAMQR